MVFFNEKKIKKDSDDFWRRKLTLKVKFWHFLTARSYSSSPNLVISFDYSWFLAKNVSNFVPPAWKLHNRYCHSIYIVQLSPLWNSKVFTKVVGNMFALHTYLLSLEKSRSIYTKSLPFNSFFADVGIFFLLHCWLLAVKRKRMWT